MTTEASKSESQPVGRASLGGDEEMSFGGAELALIQCLGRVEWLIDMETSALKRCEQIDFDDLNGRKACALLEFSRLARAVSDRVSPPVARRLERLRAKLSENAQTLAQNLQALSEISNILITSINAEESDGTYSRRPSRGR